jgi:hypothetical protein
MSARPLALSHSKLMAQHKDLGVLPPPLPPRQARQRHGTGDNQEDQLQAHKPKIIPRLGMRGDERSAVSGASGQVAQVFGTHSRPVSLAPRIRSSHRARLRCRSSRSASCPRLVLVAKHVTRCPSMSVRRSCAPGWGRSLRAMTRKPGGQPDRSSRPVSSATQAPSRWVPSLS